MFRRIEDDIWIRFYIFNVRVICGCYCYIGILNYVNVMGNGYYFKLMIGNFKIEIYWFF